MLYHGSNVKDVKEWFYIDFKTGSITNYEHQILANAKIYIGGSIDLNGRNSRTDISSTKKLEKDIIPADAEFLAVGALSYSKQAKYLYTERFKTCIASNTSLFHPHDYVFEITEIGDMLMGLMNVNKHIRLQWIPAHCRITEIAYGTAKSASTLLSVQ